jgi:hypothetical protein
VGLVGESGDRQCRASLSPEARRVNVMKPLLPQPGGFEGFRARPEGLDAAHAALLEIEELKQGVLHRDAACVTNEDGATAHQHALLADALYVVDLDVPLVPSSSTSSMKRRTPPTPR